MSGRMALSEIARDILKLAALCIGYLATFVLPKRSDPWITGRLSSLYYILRANRVDFVAAEMRSRLPELERDWTKEARESVRMRVENFWARARGIHGPSQPWELHVEGLDHYASAKAGGRGVILWRMAFADAPVINAALHAHGISVVHLSRYDHGAASDSRLGLRLTAPLFVRSELWYLAERVVIANDDSLDYMRVLLNRLEANATLSMNSRGKGRQTVPTTVLNRPVEFATGPPALAYRKGAALLPLSCVRLGPYRYVVVIEAPITPPKDENRQTYVAGAVTEYARRTEMQVRAHPADWRWSLRPS